MAVAERKDSVRDEKGWSRMEEMEEVLRMVDKDGGGG
jgi:hypothetical protein